MEIDPAAGDRISSGKNKECERSKGMKEKGEPNSHDDTHHDILPISVPSTKEPKEPLISIDALAEDWLGWDEGGHYFEIAFYNKTFRAYVQEVKA